MVWCLTHGFLQWEGTGSQLRWAGYCPELGGSSSYCVILWGPLGSSFLFLKNKIYIYIFFLNSFIWLHLALLQHAGSLVVACRFRV